MGSLTRRPGPRFQKDRGFVVLQTVTSVSRRVSHSRASVVRHLSVALVITDSKSGETFREHLVKRVG